MSKLDSSSNDLSISQVRPDAGPAGGSIQRTLPSSRHGEARNVRRIFRIFVPLLAMLLAPPTASCHISLVFTPTATGTRTASVGVSATGGGTYTVPLSGTGADSSIGPAFYVATNGSDSNPGTLASPFATLAKCQTAMRGSTTKTCYIRAGTYTPPAVSGGYGNVLLTLSSSDNGETWAYYPPDGVASAVINGQATTFQGAAQTAFWSSGSNITLNGLYFENLGGWGLVSTGANNVIENSTVDNSFGDGILVTCGGTGNLITHNVVSNTQYHGIETQCNGTGISNTTVSYNFVYNACSVNGDCGGIYVQDTTGTSTNLSYLNNYIRDVCVSCTGGPLSGTAGYGIGIYLDQGTGNATVTGNVTAGAGTNSACFTFNGSTHSLSFRYNICDLAATASRCVADMQGSQTNNLASNNIVIAAQSGSAGGGWRCTGPPSGSITIQNNLYYNQAGTGINTSGDTAPVTQTDPSLSCWNYTLASNSAAYNSPVSFPVQPSNWGTAGFWGPLGFVIPQTGTPPSIPDGC